MSLTRAQFYEMWLAITNIEIVLSNQLPNMKYKVIEDINTIKQHIQTVIGQQE